MKWLGQKEKWGHACLVAQSCPTLLRCHGLQPARLLCPWDSPGKNTGMGCDALLQGISPNQETNPHLSTLSPALKMDSLPLSLRGKMYLCADIVSIYCFNHVFPAHKAPNSSAWFSRPSTCGPMVSTWATPKGEPGCRSTWKRSKMCVCMWGGGYRRCPRWSSRVENCIKEQESGYVAVSNQLTYLHRSPEPRAGNTGGKPKIKRQRMTKTDRAGFSNQASALALILLFSDSMDGIKQTRNSVGVFESEILDVDERI